MHTEAFSRHIQVYSSIFSTLCNPCIFTNLKDYEHWHWQPEVYSKPSETLIRYIQNLATIKTVYSRIIQPHSGIFKTLCNACICINLAYSILEYSQPFHNCILKFRTLAYWQPWNIQNHDILETQYIFRTFSKI